MTPAQIKKAEQLLAKKRELTTLVDRWGNEIGSIVLITSFIANDTQPAFDLHPGHPSLSLETVEKWVKQAKKAHKMGIL